MVKQPKLDLNIEIDGPIEFGDSEIESIRINLHIVHKKGKKLDAAKVRALVKRSKLSWLSRWCECCIDIDSPQAEKTFGVRRAACG